MLGETIDTAPLHEIPQLLPYLPNL